MFIQLFPDLKWDLLARECPKSSNSSIVLGLVFKEGYDNVLIKGPNSTSPEVTMTTKFLGAENLF